MTTQKCRFNATGCRALSDAEVAAVLEKMDGRFALRDRAIAIFGIRTGYRISEILHLRVADVFDNGAVKDVVIVARERMKGGKKSRSMPIHAEAKKAIAEYLRATKMDDLFCKNWPLFPRQGSLEPLDKKAFWRILRAAAARAGVDVARLGTHSMRKTFASRLWPKLGGDLLKMSAVLGDTPTNTAAYIQFLDGSLEAAVLSE